MARMVDCHDPATTLRVRGVGRVADEPRSLLLALTERPTDDEIRSLHDFIRDWRHSTVRDHG